jgi:hypothetical protein
MSIFQNTGFVKSLFIDAYLFETSGTRPRVAVALSGD